MLTTALSLSGMLTCWEHWIHWLLSANLNRIGDSMQRKFCAYAVLKIWARFDGLAWISWSKFSEKQRQKCRIDLQKCWNIHRAGININIGLRAGIMAIWQVGWITQFEIRPPDQIVNSPPSMTRTRTGISGLNRTQNRNFRLEPDREPIFYFFLTGTRT